MVGQDLDISFAGNLPLPLALPLSLALSLALALALSLALTLALTLAPSGHLDIENTLEGRRDGRAEDMGGGRSERAIGECRSKRSGGSASERGDAAREGGSRQCR